MKNFYRHHKIIAILFIFLFIILVIVFTSVIFLNSKFKNKEVKVSTVLIDNQPDDIFKGVVEPDVIDNYVLDPSLGDLSEINITDGQEVNKEDVILTYTQLLETSDIDMTSLNFAIISAKRNLENAVQDLEDAQNKDSELRKKFYESDEDKKVEINSKIESNNELWKTANRDVQSMQIALDEANENLKNAETKVAKTSKLNVIKAKSSGIAVVSDKNDKSNPLIQIVSVDTKITAQISEFDYASIEVGTEVSVETINSGKKSIGIITSISPVPISKTDDSQITYYEFTVKLDHNLQNGFNVQVHLKKNEYIIPKTAVFNNQVKIEKDNTYIPIKVQVEEVDGEIFVKEGLKKGDKIAENFKDVK